MPATKDLPPLGTRAFEVEWCNNLPIDENGDAEIDRATYCTRVFETKEAASRFARAVYPETVGKMGSVEITPVELTDPFGEGFVSTFLWEPCGDSEWYAGEDESP